MKKYVAASIFAALCMTVALPAFAQETFTKYLQKGDRDPEVVMLQKVLNTDSDTQISAFGDGSSGQETDFFGELTKQAVIKLQKKYSLGTKYGFFTIYSGALDEKTREFLNKNELAVNTCKKKVDLSNPAAFTAFHEKVRKIKESLEPETGTASTTESKKNALNELYRLGSTNSETVPYIANVEENDDEIIITGCNFATSTPNTVNMTFNNVLATSTDGTIIVLESPEFAIQTMFDDQTSSMKSSARSNTVSKMPEIPVFVTVENTNGISNPYQFYRRIK